MEQFNQFNQSTLNQCVHRSINAIFCSLSIISFVFITMILLAYICRDEFYINTPNGIGILFFGCIVTIVADLSYVEAYEYQYDLYTLLLCILFGVIIFILSSWWLFTTPPRRANALGYHHDGIGLIIWIITVPLILFELLMFVDALLLGQHMSAILTIASQVQKLVQAGVYYYSMRLQVPKERKSRGASWFLKSSALFNFSMWLQSLMTASDRSEFFLHKIFKSNAGTNIMACAYSALMIDYRLLCSILFLEHALEIDYARPGESTRQFSREATPVPQVLHGSLHISSSRFKGLGYSIGLLVVGATCVNGMQYLQMEGIGAWTDVFAYVTELIVLVVGFALTRQIVKEGSSFPTWRETSSIGIDVMVALMGIVGIVFWLLKGSLITIWAITLPHTDIPTVYDSKYFIWQAIKCYIRSFGIIFQIYFFVKIDASFGRRNEICTYKYNFLYLPCIMLSLLAIFFNSVIDSFSGDVEHLVHNAELSIVVSSIYYAGEPIHLGFCLHVFIHFMIINRRMDEAINSIQDQLVSQRRTRALTPILEIDNIREGGSLHSDDDSNDKLRHLLGTGRKIRSL